MLPAKSVAASPPAAPSKWGWSSAATRRRFTTGISLLPALLLVLAFLLLPMGVMAYLSLSPNVLIHFNGLAFKNFEYLFSKSYYLEIIIRTIRISLITTVAALAIGYPTAYILKDISSRLGSTMILGLTFPILAGPLVVVLGWMILLSDGGPVVEAIARFGGPSSLRLMGSELAIEISLVQFTLAFVVLIVYSSLRQIDRSLLEAARSLGANRLRTFIAVVWPLSLPGVLSATLIAFSLAVSSYVAPRYLGGDTRLTITTLIGQYILATFNSPLASASAIILLALVLAFIVGYSKLMSKAIKGS